MSKKKLALIIAVAFVVGLGFGMAGDTKTIEVETVKETVRVEPVETVREVADPACRETVQMDNEIFVTMGEYFGNIDIDGLNSYLETAVPARVASMERCLY